MPLHEQYLLGTIQAILESIYPAKPKAEARNAALRIWNHLVSNNLIDWAWIDPGGDEDVTDQAGSK